MHILRIEQQTPIPMQRLLAASGGSAKGKGNERSGPAARCSLLDARRAHKPERFSQFLASAPLNASAAIAILRTTSANKRRADSISSSSSSRKAASASAHTHTAPPPFYPTQLCSVLAKGTQRATHFSTLFYGRLRKERE